MINQEECEGGVIQAKNKRPVLFKIYKIDYLKYFSYNDNSN